MGRNGQTENTDFFGVEKDDVPALVCASGIAGWGQSDAITVHKIHDRFYIVGDMISEAGEKLPPLSPRVNLTAAKQADIILEYVLDRL